MYACGEATNGRLGLGMSSGTVPIPRQITALSNYMVKKVAVHSGTCPGLLLVWGLASCSCSASDWGPSASDTTLPGAAFSLGAVGLVSQPL